MKRKWNEQQRFTEQLKFFGHKPKRFISCYAKKPRISMKPDRFRIDLWGSASREALRNRSYAAQQQVYNGQLLGLLGQNQANMAAAQSGQFGSSGGLALGAAIFGGIY